MQHSQQGKAEAQRTQRNAQRKNTGTNQVGKLPDLPVLPTLPAQKKKPRKTNFSGAIHVSAHRLRVLFGSDRFTDFSFDLVAHLRIVVQHLLHGITALADFGISVREP